MFLQPLQSSLVGQVLDLEVLELSLETLAVRTCCHHAHHDRCVVLHPAVAHHRVLLVIEGVEYLYGIQTAHSLDPHKRYGFVELDDTPVAGVVGDDGTEVVLAVYKLDTCLDVVLLIYANH